MDKEGNACGASFIRASMYESLVRTHDVLQSIPDGKFQADLVARSQFSSSSLDFPRGVDGTDSVDDALPGYNGVQNQRR